MTTVKRVLLRVTDCVYFERLYKINPLVELTLTNSADCAIQVVGSFSLSKNKVNYYRYTHFQPYESPDKKNIPSLNISVWLY